MVALTEKLGDGRWWLPQYEQDRGSRIHNVVLHIWNMQRSQREQMLLNARMYGEINLQHLTPRANRQQVTVGAKSRRACLNATGSVTDTWVSMLTKDEVGVTCQTTGASYDMRKRAETLQTFIDGAKYETDFEEVKQDVAYDCAKFNPGWVHFYEDDSDPDDIKLGCERVLPWEIVIDAQDAVYRKPQSIYRIKFRDKFALISEYPDLEHEIMNANSEGFGDTNTGMQSGGVELLPCIESYHLPRFKPKAAKAAANDNAEDGAEAANDNGEEDAEEEVPKVGGGLFVYSVGKIVLREEEYTELTFPFEALFIKKPTSGMIGEGIPDALSGIQRELNLLGAKIQRCEHLMATPHWLVEMNAKINTGHLDNQIGSIIRYQGTAPSAIVPPGVPPELFEREDKLFSRAFDVYGVSPQLAQGEAPPQLHSGEAQRVALGVASGRFLPSIREYRNFTLRCARQFVRLAARISEKRADFFVRTNVDNIAKTVRWADAHMDESEYVLRLEPTNDAAGNPEDIIDETQDFMNAGAIPQEDGLRLIAATGNRPDLKAYTDEVFASYHWSMAQIAACLNGGEPMAPNPFVNLQETVQLAQKQYLLAESKDCPTDRLDALANWLTQVQDAITAATPPPPPPPPPGAMPGAPAPGGPMAVAQHMAPPQQVVGGAG